MGGFFDCQCRRNWIVLHGTRQPAQAVVALPLSASTNRVSRRNSNHDVLQPHYVGRLGMGLWANNRRMWYAIGVDDRTAWRAVWEIRLQNQHDVRDDDGDRIVSDWCGQDE